MPKSTWSSSRELIMSFLFVARCLQVKVVVCFLILGAGRAVNVLVPYMYKIIGESNFISQFHPQKLKEDHPIGGNTNKG